MVKFCQYSAESIARDQGQLLTAVPGVLDLPGPARKERKRKAIVHSVQPWIVLSPCSAELYSA